MSGTMTLREAVKWLRASDRERQAEVERWESVSSVADAEERAYVLMQTLTRQRAAAHTVLLAHAERTLAAQEGEPKMVPSAWQSDEHGEPLLVTAQDWLREEAMVSQDMARTVDGKDDDRALAMSGIADHIDTLTRRLAHFEAEAAHWEAKACELDTALALAKQKCDARTVRLAEVEAQRDEAEVLFGKWKASAGELRADRDSLAAMVERVKALPKHQLDDGGSLYGEWVSADDLREALTEEVASE